jgi:hypothetical protein
MASDIFPAKTQMTRFFQTAPFRSLLAVLVLLASASEAMATLGKAPSRLEAASSSTPGAKKLAAAQSPQAALYTMHVTQLENGTTLQEYVTPAGLVFAVAWRGPVLPDLNALLGDYFSTFRLEAEQARTSGQHRSSMTMARAGLVLSSNGRMRNFFGHAYAPDLIPSGVNIKDVLQ